MASTLLTGSRYILSPKFLALKIDTVSQALPRGGGQVRYLIVGFRSSGSVQGHAVLAAMRSFETETKVEKSMHQEVAQIIKTARTIPFTEPELRKAMDSIKVRKSKGTDLTFGHPHCTATGPEIIKSAMNGAIFLYSPEQLSAGFLFVKLDAGRSLFGGQKAVYASYYQSELHEDQWFAGTTFKSWMIALTSIGNIYRSEGYK